MKYLKPIVLLLLVFVAGICVGVVGTRATVRRYIRQAVRQPEVVEIRIERNLANRLDLDAGQQEKLHAILADSQREIRDLRQDVQPRYRTIIADTQKRISEMLTPEQLAKFEKLRAAYGSMLPALQGPEFPRLQRFKNRQEQTP